MVLGFFFETFSLGLKNLRLHKLRSLLTTLGIIFGVAAVIIMVAIGEGSKQAALDQVRQLGAQNIRVRAMPPAESNDASGRTTRVLIYGLKRIDLTRLEELPSLSAVVPLRDTEQKVVVGAHRASVHPIGTMPGFFDIINLPLERGRYLNEVDIAQESQVCVLGALAAQQLFPYEDPLHQRVQVGSGESGIVMLEVVGVLERTGLTASTGERSLDQELYFPLSLARTTFGDTIIRRSAGGMERKEIQLTDIWLRVKEMDRVEETAAIVENVLALGHAGPKDYDVMVPLERLRQAEQLNRIFNFIMVGIASFSLVVGGIGIMNIMLATVTERTREIGIRRALGAKRRHVTLQFLIETTLISLAGGAIGIILGAVGAVVLPIIVRLFSDQPYPTQIAMWSIVGSFGVSALIGIAFGLYPAIKAAYMNPIEALRHE